MAAVLPVPHDVRTTTKAHHHKKEPCGKKEIQQHSHGRFPLGIADNAKAASHHSRLAATILEFMPPMTEASETTHIRAEPVNYWIQLDYQELIGPLATGRAPLNLSCVISDPACVRSAAYYGRAGQRTAALVDGVALL